MHLQEFSYPDLPLRLAWKAATLRQVLYFGYRVQEWLLFQLVRIEWQSFGLPLYASELGECTYGREMA